MAAHIGVTSTYGVTLPAGAEAQSASKTETIEISELTGAAGEYVKADALFAKKVEVSIGYVGEPMHSSIVSGAVADPSTMTVIKSEATEQNKGRVACTVNAVSHEAFEDDGAGASPGEGEAGPDEDTLNLVSCTLSLAENVQVTKEVQDKMILNAAGVPGARARCQKKNAFSVRWKGDLPTGVVLGLGGAGVFGLTGGKLLASKLMVEQKMDDFNGGSVEGNHYPVAA